MADTIYNRFFYNLMVGAVDIDTGGDTVKCALLNNTHSIDKDDDVWSDVSAEEVSGTGYTTGGKTLTISTHPTSGGTTAYLDFSDVTWTSASITAAGALIYKDDGATYPAIAVLSFGGDKTSSAGDFTIQFPTADASNAIIRIA